MSHPKFKGIYLFSVAFFVVQLAVANLTVYAQVSVKERAAVVSKTPKPIAKLPSWTLGPFIRPANVNPVISPAYDPMRGKQVDWESNDTFNPAATVKDGKIYVLYRAEDKSGIAIGERTSRIGLAESNDGITMKRAEAPVLFPGDDHQKEFEWTGGCEDPRVAVTEDCTPNGIRKPPGWDLQHLRIWLPGKNMVLYFRMPTMASFTI
jgi:hypothetical protein